LPPRPDSDPTAAAYLVVRRGVRGLASKGWRSADRPSAVTPVGRRRRPAAGCL